jgi:hypothetical protein
MNTLLLLWLWLTTAWGSDTLTCKEVQSWLAYKDTPERTLIERLGTFDRFQKGLVDCVRDEAPAAFVEALQARIDGRTPDFTTRYELDVRAGSVGEQIGAHLADHVQSALPQSRAIVLVWTDDQSLMPDWAYDLHEQVSASLLTRLPTNSVDIGSPKALGQDASPAPTPEQRTVLANKGYLTLLFLSRERGQRDVLEFVVSGYVEDADSGEHLPIRVVFAPDAASRRDMPGGRVVRATADRAKVEADAGATVALRLSLVQSDGARVSDVQGVTVDGRPVPWQVDPRAGQVRLTFLMPSLVQPTLALVQVLLSDGARTRTFVQLSNLRPAPVADAAIPGLRASEVRAREAATRNPGRVRRRDPSGLILKQGWWGVSFGVGAGGLLAGGEAVARPDTRVYTSEEGETDPEDVDQAERAQAYSELSVPLGEALTGRGFMEGTLGLQLRLSAIRVQADLGVGALAPAAQFQTSQDLAAIDGRVGFSLHYGGFLGFGYGAAPASIFLGWRAGGHTLGGSAVAQSGPDPGEFDLRMGSQFQHGPQLVVDLFADNFNDGTSRRLFAVSLDVRALVFGEQPQIGGAVSLLTVFGK